MPLSYDDLPGSWGAQSKRWPALVFGSEADAQRAYIACSKLNIVPYGSYVLMGHELRVEDIIHKIRLATFLAETPYKTFEELKAYLIDKNLW